MTQEIKIAAEMSGNPSVLTLFNGVKMGSKHQLDRQRLAEIIIAQNAPLTFKDEWDIANGRRGGATLVVNGKEVGVITDGVITFFPV